MSTQSPVTIVFHSLAFDARLYIYREYVHVRYISLYSTIGVRSCFEDLSASQSPSTTRPVHTYDHDDDAFLIAPALCSAGCDAAVR
jgi:hypothetical protein